MNLAPIVAVLVVAAASGCMESTSGEVSAESADSENPGSTVVLSRHGRTNLTLAAGYEVSERIVSQLFLDVQARHDISAILVELAWNDTIQDLDAVLFVSGREGCGLGGFPPDLVKLQNFTNCQVRDQADLVQEGNDGYHWNMEGSFGSPDTPSRILLEADDIVEEMNRCPAIEECVWKAGHRTKEGHYDVEFFLYLTVFYNQSVPDGYTALPWG